jgi:hypothetical protein
MVADFTVQNGSDYNIKDMTIKCMGIPDDADQCSGACRSLIPG